MFYARGLDGRLGFVYPWFDLLKDASVRFAHEGRNEGKGHWKKESLKLQTKNCDDASGLSLTIAAEVMRVM